MDVDEDYGREIMLRGGLYVAMLRPMHVGGSLQGGIPVDAEMFAGAAIFDIGPRVRPNLIAWEGTNMESHEERVPPGRSS